MFYVHVFACFCMYQLTSTVHCGLMCAIGLHWASCVAEGTRRDHLLWNFILLFKEHQPDSLWAKPWPKCWCSTGGCLSRARRRHANHTRPICSTPPCQCGHASAWFGEWCCNPLQEWEAACPECETGEQHTRQARATGGTASWSRSARCWAANWARCLLPSHACNSYSPTGK